MASNDNVPKPRPESIPVARLVLAHPVDGIEMNGLTGIRTSKPDAPPNRARHVITFVPFMRHHEIQYFRPNTPEPELHYVHESQVKTWHRGG